MITAVLIGDKEVMARVRRFDARFRGNLLRRVLRLSILLQAYVKTRKLSGQALKRKTGTLSRSINRKIKQTPIEISATVGTNVVYGKIHEYGFTGTENVRSHLRNIKQAFGRPIAPREIMISAHSRKMVMPMRSFLRSSLQEMTPQIRAEMTAALSETVAAP